MCTNVNLIMKDMKMHANLQFSSAAQDIVKDTFPSLAEVDSITFPELKVIHKDGRCTAVCSYGLLLM
jgi:hypothetical protein